MQVFWSFPCQTTFLTSSFSCPLSVPCLTLQFLSLSSTPAYSLLHYVLPVPCQSSSNNMAVSFSLCQPFFKLCRPYPFPLPNLCSFRSPETNNNSLPYRYEEQDKWLDGEDTSSLYSPATIQLNQSYDTVTKISQSPCQVCILSFRSPLLFVHLPQPPSLTYLSSVNSSSETNFLK